MNDVTRDVLLREKMQERKHAQDKSKGTPLSDVDVDLLHEVG
jgi:hypothetical protein